MIAGVPPEQRSHVRHSPASTAPPQANGAVTSTNGTEHGVFIPFHVCL